MRRRLLRSISVPEQQPADGFLPATWKVVCPAHNRSAAGNCFDFKKNPGKWLDEMEIRRNRREWLNVAHRSTKDQTPPSLLLAANNNNSNNTAPVVWTKKSKEEAFGVKNGEKRRRKAAAAAIFSTKSREKWTHARKVLRRRRCNKQKRRPATTKHLADGPQTEEMFSYFLNVFFFLKGLAFVLWPPPPQNKRCCFIRAEGNHFTLSFSHLSVVSRFLLPFRRLSASWNKRLAPTMEAHHHGPTQATCCTSVNRNDGRKKRHTLARWLAGATYHQPATPFLPKNKIKEKSNGSFARVISLSCVRPPRPAIISTRPRTLCNISH